MVYTCVSSSFFSTLYFSFFRLVPFGTCGRMSCKPSVQRRAHENEFTCAAGSARLLWAHTNTHTCTQFRTHHTYAAAQNELERVQKKNKKKKKPLPFPSLAGQTTNELVSFVMLCAYNTRANNIYIVYLYIYSYMMSACVLRHHLRDSRNERMFSALKCVETIFF